MSQEVTVHVNRGSTDTLEAAVDTLETSDSFTLVVASHDSPAHIHCRLHGDLAQITALEASNYYVESDGETLVPVRVADGIDTPVEGTLEVVTGYGAESVSIAVTVVPGPAAVDIDDSLAEPAQLTPEPSPLERVIAASRLEPATLAVVGLGLLAIIIATMTAATIGGLLALVGLGIVGLGFCVAVALLVH